MCGNGVLSITSEPKGRERGSGENYIMSGLKCATPTKYNCIEQNAMSFLKMADFVLAK
jgi:hypothetical protein